MKPRFQKVPSGPSYYANTYGISVNKGMKKKLTILFTALILASAAGINMAYAQEDPALVAENLLDAVYVSSTEVNNLFDVFVAGNGIVPDDAAEALADAETLFAEALAAFEAGEYEEAIEKATEALNKYGEASAYLTELEPEDEEDETEETFDKLGGYERALERLEKLQDIAVDLDEQGVNVLEAVGLLDEAESILGDIGAAIDLGEFDGLEALLEEANSLIGQATGLLQSSSNQKRVEKTELFITQTRHHFSQLETKLYRIMAKYDISGEDSEAIRLRFQSLKDSLEELEEDVEQDDLKQLTRRLQHVVKESNEIGKKETDDIDEEIIEKVNEVSKKESKLYRYRERLEVLAQLGYDDSEAGELLNHAEQLLNQAQNSIDDGDEETADDLIDEADALIDEADELIDDIEKGRRHGSQDDDEDNDKNGFQKKVQALRRSISRYRLEIQNRNHRGEDTTELEAQLDELEQALDEALTEEDADLIEDQLDELEGLIEDDSDNDRGNSGKGKDDDDEPEEPEEPEEEDPESTG